MNTHLIPQEVEKVLRKRPAKQNKANRNYYNYHTDWSFSPREILTFIVPSFYGFGISTYNGPLTKNQDV